MKKMIPCAALLLFIHMLFYSLPVPVSACSCAEPSTPKGMLSESEAVFVGEVVETKKKRYLAGTAQSTLFQVNKIWKGTDQSQIIIGTGLGGGDCGIEFVTGEEYIVYADESSMFPTGGLETSICDRTINVDSAGEDLRVLGSGRSPTKEVDLTNHYARNNIYTWTAVGVILIIAVIIILERKNKNRNN